MNVVLSGASSGIGFEAALELCRNKAHRVLALARSSVGLDALMQRTTAENLPGRLTIYPFDIVHGDYNDVHRMLAEAFGDERPAVHALVNNAGSLINKPFAETTAEDFLGLMEINVVGHVKLIQAVLPFLGPQSHILNIGSMGGFAGSVKFPGLSAYSASKAALHVLTECLAAELADQQIGVNCLALGSAQTEMLNTAFPGYRSPMTAGEMGALVADFCLTGHKFFNGKILPVSLSTP